MIKEIIPKLLFKINDKFFETVDISLDNPPCMNCNQLIDDVPLRMWTGKGKECRELHFCWDCAFDLKILNQLTDRRERG